MTIQTILLLALIGMAVGILSGMIGIGGGIVIGVARLGGADSHDTTSGECDSVSADRGRTADYTVGRRQPGTRRRAHAERRVTICFSSERTRKGAPIFS